MTTEEHLINQHILEYESRLKHIDELLKQAQRKAADTRSDIEEADLEKIREQRKELENYLDSVKTMSADHWEKDTINMSGPMAVWDAVAQKLEKIIEGKS